MSSTFNFLFGQFAPSISVEDLKRADNLIQTEYVIVAKNVNSLSQVEIICLGERHKHKTDISNNTNLITLLSKKGDLVLTEFDESDLKQSEQKILESKHLVPEEKKSFIFLQFFYSTFNQVQMLNPELEFKGWDSRSQETRGMCRKYGDAVEFHCSKQLYEELPLRNRHLCKAIEKYQTAGRKFFVVAGANHLRPADRSFRNRIAHWIFGSNLQFQDQAYQETLHFLKDKKFMILIPKDLGIYRNKKT